MPKDEDVKKSWDAFWSANESGGVHMDWPWEVLKKYIPRSGRIIDMGCGAGAHLKKIQKFLPSAVGSDISKSGLRGLENVFVSNNSKMPLKSRYFDAVLSLSVLEYVEDINEAVKEINRILKPGGYLILTLPNLFCLFSIERKFRKALNRYGILYRDFIIFTPRLVKALLKETGLRIKHVSGINTFKSYPVQKAILRRKSLANKIFKIERTLPDFILSNFSHEILIIAEKTR